MNDTVLVVNAGSSSIKFALYPVEGNWKTGVIFRGQIEGIGHVPRFHAWRHDGTALATPVPSGNGRFAHAEALALLLDWLQDSMQGCRLVGAGHRVVHGGEDYATPVLIDEKVIRTLESLIPLARLHEPYELAAILAIMKLDPGIPQVACFDTAFHRTQPPMAQLFALPREFNAAGVKRYGFHGLSYEYIAAVLPEYLGTNADGRVVVAHLGAGASMCAMRARTSVATTMGFTALEGLMMGTRSGALDPGVLLYLIQEKGMSPQEVNDLLYNRSGLLGVSGLSADMRVLLAADHPHAREAVALFVYRACRELGSLAAALGGLDALVFTGGIGEHAAEIRARVCEQSAWLGIDLDASANARGAACITRKRARASAWVIPTNEEIVIARQTCQVLAPRPQRRVEAAAPAAR
ncbi:MAG: acetate/propionate family kinase [Betaproteobacteria bacterium]|nr:acetate/propionate family kinase [Betaproteobacteria bacterium]